MAAERTPGSFGSRLREARERRGISLRQIANATKISMGALEALERNDISRLPGGIFSRAFVRSFAIEVGLEPEETIRDFIAQFPHDSVTAGHPASAQIDDSEALESSRRRASTFLRLIALSVPIAAVVLYFGTSGRRSSDPLASAPVLTGPVSAKAAAPPAPADGAPAQPASPPTSPSGETAPPVTAPPAPEKAEVDRLMVGVSATGPCWISATVDGHRVIAHVLQAGEQHTMEIRRELVLIAGDAAAITWTLNGATARPLGKAGAVVTTRVNLTNFKDYLAPQ
jgi:cytoskeletal protein RodZ